MRPIPKLIDPGLLGKVNKVYIGRQSQNNFILEWIINKIYPFFKDNIFFNIIVFGLIGYLLYRYFENIKKKNRIIKNIDEDKPIPVKLNKPINYSEKNDDKNKDEDDDENEEFNNDKINDSEISKLSEMTNLSSPKNIIFDKELERELKIGNNVNQELNNLPPELVRQKILLEERNISQPNQMGEHINTNINKNLLETNMSMNVLQQNMNQFKNLNQSCSNFKTTSIIEPTAGNAFSDNFMNF